MQRARSRTTAAKKPPPTSKPKKPTAVKAAARKAVTKKPAATKATAKRAGAKKFASRADLGNPIDGFFAKQSPQLRPVAEALRTLIEESAPGAHSSLKWGMPFYTVNGAMMCAIGGHKAHVNLILSGPPDAFADPEGRLSGNAKTGRHLKLTSLDDLPRDSVRHWLRTAVQLARQSSRE